MTLTEHCNDYLMLCKPKVVLLMLVTVWVGMYLADSRHLRFSPWFMGTFGIACVAGAAAAFNHLIERHIDAKMQRTQRRPLAAGRLQPQQAFYFAMALMIVGLFTLCVAVNYLTAVLSFFSLLGYAAIYTTFLKHATPQNIVIGGAAGAAPPLLGWCAVSGQVTAQALLLSRIIFVWSSFLGIGYTSL
jgi:protoheme IX farnesyltransferase